MAGERRDREDQWVQEELSVQIGLSMARIRIAVVACFFAIVAQGGFMRGERHLRNMTPDVAGYLAFAVLIWLGLRNKKLRGLLNPVWPFLEVAYITAIRFRIQPETPSPQAAAVLTIAVLMLVVFFSSFALGPKIGLATALTATVGAWLLSWSSQSQVANYPASALLLVSVALASSTFARKLQQAVQRITEEEAARKLADQHAAELERAEEATSRAKAEIERQHARLIEAQRQAEEMTAFLVHDMKGPLTVTMTLTEVLAGEAGRDPRLEANLLLIGEQQRRLLGMIGDLLAISRLEAGTLTPRLVPTPADKLLLEVARPHLPFAGASDITLSVRAEPGLTVAVDAELAHRVLENLLTNALSMVEAGARVELSAVQEGSQMALAVRNTGSRIAEELRPRLFVKHATDQRGTGHAGLGLYFCRLVAEAHRGGIRLEETAEWPVGFIVRLPASSGGHA